MLRTGLVSDHLRAITPPEMSQEDFEAALQGIGLSQLHVEVVEPTLEELFLALAAD